MSVFLKRGNGFTVSARARKKKSGLSVYRAVLTAVTVIGVQREVFRIFFLWPDHSCRGSTYLMSRDIFSVIVPPSSFT